MTTDNPPLSLTEFRARLNRTMQEHAVAHLAPSARLHFEIVPTPEPGRERVRAEILALFDEDVRPHRTQIVNTVMPVVDELLARARCMADVANLLSRENQRLAVELAAAQRNGSNADQLAGIPVGSRVTGYAGQDFGTVTGTLVADVLINRVGWAAIRVDGEPTPYAVEVTTLRVAQAGESR